MAGNLSGGKMVASGTVSTTATSITVNTVNFKPKFLSLSADLGRITSANDSDGAGVMVPVTSDGNTDYTYASIATGKVVTPVNVTFNNDGFTITNLTSGFSSHTYYWTVTN